MKHQQILLAGSRRPRKTDAKRIANADPRSQVEVTIDLQGPELPGPNNLPSTSLTYPQLEEKYGSSRSDAEKVAKVLKEYGLKIKEISLGTHSMRVSGTVAAMEKAFNPNLGIYRSKEQGEYRGREGTLKIPAELKGIVKGVHGFDQRRVARRRSKHAARASAPSVSLAHMTPANLEALYSFPPGDGTGQTIAIAEFGGGYFPDDLNTFCSKHGLPVPTVTIVPVNLQPLTLQQIQQLSQPDQNNELGEASEVMMDIQIVAGLCPGASIFVYFSTFDQKGWVDLINTVLKARPVTLSISWGAPEDSPDWSASARDAINQRLNMAALLGITTCVSSGDDGSGDEMTDGRAHVDFPSVSPFTLSVGGTMVTGAPPDTTEQVWWQSPGRRIGNGHSGAGGGGVSTIFERPQWQTVTIKSVNAGGIDGRVIPDVAALAGPPLYDLTLLGGDAPNGGTSASAPLWAALIARIDALLPANEQQRFLTPLLYEPGSNGKPRGQSGCRDITVGQNASHPEPGVGYQATPGYDAVSGWGVPIGAALLSALQ
jgi:kumamolisin